MEKNDLLNIPFDQYQRYRYIADIIEQIRKRGEKFQILELGSNYQMNLKKFIPHDEIFCVDLAYPLSPEELEDSVLFVVGDAMHVPFADNTFDIVVSLDVFEHIESGKRRLFLKEMVRLSKRCSILAGPFDTEDVALHEMLLDEYFKTFAGCHHPWLKEHINNKLPGLEWTVAELRKIGLTVSIFENGYLPRWSRMMRMHLYVANSEGLIPYLERIYSFYNKVFYEYDNKGPSYRKILVFSKEGLKIKIDVKAEDDHCKGNEKILDELISSLYQLSNRIDLKHHAQQIQAKDGVIQEQAQQIQAKDSVIQEQAQHIEAKDTHIGNLAEQIDQLRKEFQAKDSVIQEQSQQIQAKDGVIQEQVHQIQEQAQQIQAKDGVIQEQAQQIQAKDGVIQEQAQENLTKNTHIHNIESELSLIKQSRVWRIAEFFRRFFYIKLLGRFPLVQKGMLTISREGLLQFMTRTRGYFRSDYDTWIKRKVLTHKKINEIKKEITRFDYKPKISVIMPVHNVDQIWLEKAIGSVINQLYENWEVCVVDDASTEIHIKKTLKRYLKKDRRIKVRFLKENQGIAGASNEAVSLATGEFIGLLDHDDELTQDALYEVVKVINQNDADIIYSDEDLINNSGEMHSAHFKPDFSPDLLLSHNYITHLLVARKSLFHEVGGFFSKYDGAQDYDLILKLTEKTEKIYHIRKVLYHWRTISTSTSANPESKYYADNAGKAALEAALDRRRISGTVLCTENRFHYRVKRNLLSQPLISIIIPFKDKPDLVKRCIESILNKTSYQNFEIVGISNSSEKKETFEAMINFQNSDNRIRFFEYNIPFNYSKINNYAISLVRGEHILFMNNDIEIINPDWIESMLEHSQREEVGVVGALLYYPNDTVQHGGVIVGLGGVAAHSHKHYRKDSFGYFGRLKAIQNLSAITGACMMTRKSIFKTVGGFDEQLSHAFNDVDYCLKIREKGYLIVYTPYAEFYHHESISRGYEDTPEKEARFESEKEYFGRRWKDILVNGDPYYNPNLTIDREDFSIKI